MFSTMTNEAWIMWACLMCAWTAIQVLLNLPRVKE